MSRSTGIRIDLFWEIPTTTTLTLLLDYGWTLVPQSPYLPLNAEETWDWQIKDTLTVDELFPALQQKEIAREPLGVTVRWLEPEVFSVLIIRGKSVEMQLDLYPNKQIADIKYFYPDVTWYLERFIVPILHYKDKENCIENMEWYWHW